VRHLRSILYAAVLAPAVWILCGVGFDQDLTGRARDNGGVESLSGVLLLLLAGAAYAILLFSPISPAGPLLAGLTFLGVGAWARLAPTAYAQAWPSNVAKDGFNVSTPGYGLALLLAVPLICTALSARRWAAYEPPRILLLGTIGRARGAAQVAGTTMASERTTVIGGPRPGFAPPAVSPAMPPAVSLSPGDGERTAVLPVGRPKASDGTTIVVSVDDEEKTTVMRLGGPAERTTAVPVARPAARQQASDETTTVVPVDDDEKTTVMRLGGPAAVAESPTVPSAAGHNAATGPKAAAVEDATEALAPEDKPTADVVAVEPPTSAMALADVATRDVLTADETTRDVASSGGDARSVPNAATPDVAACAGPVDAAGDETTRDVGADRSAHDIGSGGGPTQASTSDEPTRAAAAGEPTEAGAAGEPTEAGAGPVSDDGDEKTQVLRLPAAAPDSGSGHAGADAGNRNPIGRATGHGEQTQVIRLGTVEPPGDRTQLLTFPAPGGAGTVATQAGERTQETGPSPRQEITKPMSIVGEERPDPGEDPTTRLIMPAAEPGAGTTRQGKDRRALTVTNLERPLDEAADDTHPLAIPAQRQPADE
jgi:hypothetical protein